MFGKRFITVRAISALSGIDIALWDIYGQYINQPIGQLLGGDLAQPVLPDDFAGYREVRDLLAAAIQICPGVVYERRDYPRH